MGEIGAYLHLLFKSLFAFLLLRARDDLDLTDSSRLLRLAALSSDFGRLGHLMEGYRTWLLVLR